MLKSPFSYRLLALSVCIAFALPACQSLPSSGPSLSDIIDADRPTQEQLSALPPVEVIDMNDEIAATLSGNPTNQSLVDWENNGSPVDLVGKGDVLDITIWEAPPALLFGGMVNSAGSGTAQTVQLPTQAVNDAGTISVPFAGSLHVVNKTPTQIQHMINGRLSRKANQPQALVRVSEKKSNNVTVIRAGRSINMPLTAHRERVLDAVAAVGGVESGVQDISLQLTRNHEVRTISLETVTSDPKHNIVLRSGDILTMMATPLSFTALGAVGKNQQVHFAARGMNLAEALGEMGGLQDLRADARGIFVFRYQPLTSLPEAAQTSWLAQGFPPNMDIPVVYRVNLKEPQSLFWMQQMQMRNKDIVYIANAPLTEVQKFLMFVFSPASNNLYQINRLINP